MKRWIKRIIFALVLLLIVAVAGGYFYMLPTFKVATGYTAKVLCSNHFLTGQSVETVMDEMPDNPLVPFLHPQLDAEKGEATVTLWGWAASQTAIYRPGLGCTLLAGEKPYETRAYTPPPAPALDASVPWPAGDAPAQTDARLAPVLDRWFAETNPQNPRRTRAILVVKDGQIIAERYAEGYGKDTPFLGWSMTKSVTNALLGILVQQGKLDIMAPAPVPEWAAADDPRHLITTDQLIRMSSGLESSEDYGDLKSDVVQMLYNSSDMGAYAANKPLVAPPDTLWHYSSGTANILARLIRHTIGGNITDVWAFPQQALFHRIGVTSAVIEPDASGTFVGSSYMYATARDWARFGQLYLQDGQWEDEQILPPGWVDYTRTPAPASHGQYGALWWLNYGSGDDKEWPGVPEDAYAAEGHDGQYVVVIPSRNMVIVRLGVSRHGAWQQTEFLKDVLAATQ